MKHLTKFITVFFILITLLQSFYRVNTASAFSVGDEKKVGEQLLTMVRKEFKLIDEPDIIQYINELGKATLEVAGPQFFDYHFFIINNKELNAFAAPSGLIFFHSGLLQSLDTENELVGVMAHEIGHVVSRHLADRVKKSGRINAATMLGVLVGIAIGAGPLSEAIITGSAAAGQTASLAFSRLDEEEADRLAFKWMREEKRDPGAMVHMLGKIHTMNRYRMGYVPPYLLTHPGADIRMSYIQDLILFGEKKPYEQTDNFNFQRIKSRVISMTTEPEKLISSSLSLLTSINSDSREAAMVHYILSQAYLAAADYNKAENELRKTMADYPDKTILKTDLGVIFLKSGQYEAALSLLQKTDKEDRNNAYTLYNLAWIYEKTGKVQVAADLYEGLISIIPDYSQLYFQLANVEASLGKKGEGFYYYGYYYYYEGDLENAKRHYTKAISLLPRDSRMKIDAENMLKKIARFEKEE